MKNYLPGRVLELIDYENIEISKDTFIEEDLREYFSDTLYNVRLGGKPGYVYALFEHKSSTDELTLLQVLGYMVEIWKLHVKQHKVSKGLPIIIPLVIYHGVEKWKVAERLSEILDGPVSELREYIPDYGYLLYDLSRYSDEEIKGGVLLKVFLLMLKYIKREDLGEKLSEIFMLLAELRDKERGLEYLEVLLRYLSQATERVGEDAILEALKQTIGEGGESLMPTLAEKWYHEGEEKGMEKGMEKGVFKAKKEDIIKLHKRANMQAEHIADVLEIELDFVRSVLEKEGKYR